MVRTLMPTSGFNVTSLVDKRSILSKEIDNSLQALSTVGNILSAIRAVEERSAEIFGEKEADNAESPATKLVRQVSQEQQRLIRLRERFDKDELCVGVVGLARQGKSTTLQSLSGLDAHLIPTDNGLHCTAVTSFITNGERESIHVRFRSREDFFNNTILPFFSKLSLSPEPKTLAEFEISELPRLKNDADSFDKSQYKKLQEYHRHISEYNYLLNGNSRQVGMDELSKYAVHQTRDREKVYRYLAVDRIEISCRFPQSQVGKLTLIDMPGAGDVSSIDGLREIKKLIGKVDFLLFVRKPDAMGDAWTPVDLELYNACNEAMNELGIPDLDIQSSSFLVLNHVDISPSMNNLDNCVALQATAEKHGMRFSETAILDCADQGAVSEKILGEISSFVNKISQQDDQIIQRSRENISSILKQAGDMVNIREEENHKDGPLDLYVFKETFNNLWNIQTNAFENLLKEKYSLCLVPNELIFDHFRTTKSNVKALLGKLTVTDIKLARNAVGSYNKAYEDFLNEYKTHITNEFIKLDAILLQVLNGIKNEVYEVLANEGKLGYMRESGRPFDAVLVEEVASISELKNSLISFIGFQLSYLGFLHFKIREYLDVLTPDFLEIRLSREDSAEDILRYIKHSVEACLYKIEKEFYIWSQDINKISFSLLEEFLNQIFRSKHAKDNWEIFYQVNSHKIWSEYYGVSSDKKDQYTKLRKYLNNSNGSAGKLSA